MSQELLQRIAENTTPRKTSMITISSTSPSFRVNFPSPIPVSELALAKLRVYHSWPNIRLVTHGNQQPNNSLVFANKNKPDGTPDWQIVSIPTGSYQIEDINDEFQRRIKSITGEEKKITINVHEPTLSSSIEITEGYSVNIYRSSIRTVLGWPDRQIIDIEPEPVKSDYITDRIAADNPIKSYRNFEDVNFTKAYTDDIRYRYVLPAFIDDYKLSDDDNTIKLETRVNLVALSLNFKSMNKDFNILLLSLKSGSLTRAEFISVVSAGNKIIYDMETFYSRLINVITDENSPASKSDMGIWYNNKIKENPNFKLDGYKSEELKKELNDAIDEGFKNIHDAWVKKSQQREIILTHNNSQDGDGRHIAPNNVNISSVISLNLTCDAIEGSYQINLTKSDQAQQGYILYSFSPTSPPAFLIVEDPVNPVYMRCHNKFLTSINFSLTDQANNLIDLRGEELVISLFVKS